jgi:hypothetical protein
MAVEHTNLRDVARDRPAALPQSEITITPGLVDQIPEKFALLPQHVIPFLAGQSVRLKEITERPEIKTMAAEIPGWELNENMPVVSALDSGEQTALDEWREERFALLRSQAGDANLEGLENEIKSYIDEAVKNNPDMFGRDGAGATVDVFDQWFTSNMVAETEETKKKYHQLLAAAAASGNAEDVLLAMTFRHAQSSMLKMGKLLESYKTHMDSLDKLQADLDLKGFKGDLSQADMMKVNMEFARSSGDSNNTMQMIMKTMSEYERTMQSASSMNKSLGEPLVNTIRNMKT